MLSAAKDLLLGDSTRSAALAGKTKQQSNPDAKDQSSQHKELPDVEADGAHHQKAGREKKSGKFRIHSHSTKWPRMLLWFAMLHIFNPSTPVVPSPR